MIVVSRRNDLLSLRTEGESINHYLTLGDKRETCTKRTSPLAPRGTVHQGHLSLGAKRDLTPRAPLPWRQEEEGATPRAPPPWRQEGPYTISTSPLAPGGTLHQEHLPLGAKREPTPTAPPTWRQEGAYTNSTSPLVPRGSYTNSTSPLGRMNKKSPLLSWLLSRP
jgi:hypothetical protein